MAKSPEDIHPCNTFGWAARDTSEILSIQFEHEVETVMNVLQPGPLRIVEHKFIAHEIQQAKIALKRVVKNWNMNDKIEGNSDIFEGYIHK